MIKDNGFTKSGQGNRLFLATVLLVAATSFAGTWIASPGKGSHASVVTGPAMVQSNGGMSANNTSVAVSFGSTPTAGNTVVVAMALYNTDAPGGAVTDNQGNTYTLIVTSGAAGNAASTGLYVSNNVASSGTFTVTANSGSNTFPTIAIMEWSGINNTTPTTASATSTGSSTTATTTSITAANVLVGVTSHDGVATTLTPSNTEVFEWETGTGGVPMAVQYRVVTGAATISWTYGASRGWDTSVVSLDD